MIKKASTHQEQSQSDKPDLPVYVHEKELMEDRLLTRFHNGQSHSFLGSARFPMGFSCAHCPGSGLFIRSRTGDWRLPCVNMALPAAR